MKMIYVILIIGIFAITFFGSFVLYMEPESISKSSSLIGEKVSSTLLEGFFAITQFANHESIDVNVTQEDNFTHLTINDQTPFTQTGYGLVVYFPLDVNDSDRSNMTFDYTEFNNDGDVNATWNDTCLYGACYEFDGFGNYVNITNATFLTMLVDSPRTYSFWVKRTGNSGTAGDFPRLLSFGSDGGGMEIGEHVTSHNLTWFDGVWHDTGGDGNLSLNQWHHVVLSFNVSTVVIYKDNVIVDSVSSAGRTSDDNVEIGNRESNHNEGFKGFIDEVMIFNHSLNSSQINDIYNNRSARFKSQGLQTLRSFNITAGENTINVTTNDFDTNIRSELEVRVGEWDISRGYNDSFNGTLAAIDGVVAYWHFDNVSGLGETDNIVIDFSGNGFNGTVEGGNHTINDSIYGRAMQFDDANDFITVGDRDILNNLTIATWINHRSPDSAGFSTIISKAFGTVGNGEWVFQVDKNTGSDTIRWNCGGTINAGTTLFPNDEWLFVAVTMNQVTNEVSIYTNMVQENFTNVDTCLAGDSESITIGGISSNGDYEGYIDDMILINRTLSFDELKELYIQGRNNWNYSTTGPYQNVSADPDDNNFNINISTTNILPDYRFSPGNGTNINHNNSFYSPVLLGDISFDWFTGAVDNPPVSILSRPANDSVFSTVAPGNNVTFEVNGTDDILLVNVSWILYNPDDTINSTQLDSWNGTSNSTLFFFNFTADGLYLWNALVSDSLGQTDWDVNRTINITTFTDFNPNVTINSPLNQTFTTTTITFNVTALDDDGMSDVLYSLDGGLNNFTMANLSTSPTQWTAVNSTMAQGSHTVRFFANDTNNNLNDSEEVTFFIDSIPPTFDNIQNHTQVGNLSFFFDLNATDVSAIDTFRLNQTTLFNITRDGRIRNISALNLVAIHNLIVFVNDTLNNTAQAEFFINITAPVPPRTTTCNTILETRFIKSPQASPYVQLCFGNTFT